MKQITSEQAIAFAESKVWAKWSSYEICRFQLFQDKLAIPFEKFHEAVEKELGRPVFTHEFGLNYEGIMKEFLHEKDPPTWEEIINIIPEDKRIIFTGSVTRLENDADLQSGSVENDPQSND